MKTETTHTPGPLDALRWEKLEGRRRVFMPQADYVLTTADGQVTSVCASAFGVERVVPEGIDARLARLIAAAPDLLAAATLALEIIEQHGLDECDGEPTNAARDLRAAIARAGGR